MRKIFCLVVIVLLLGSAQGAWAFFSTHSTNVTRSVDNGQVTVSFTNSGAEDLRGFYYVEHLPEMLTLTTVSIRLGGVALTTYQEEQGSSGEVYTGRIPHRWILELPPDFTENHPIGSGALEIVYQLSSPTGGSFTLDEAMWVGYYADAPDNKEAFGYSEAGDSLPVALDGPSFLLWSR